MLFLKPPYHIIEGVAVFADHANERQFYYLPAMPKLTMVSDPILGIPLPRINLIRFRGDAGDGGLLSFEVNLGFEQERLDTVKRELKRLHELREDPIMSPAILEDGTVRLMILGSETEAPPAAGQPPAGGGDEEPRFKVKINHPAKPALYGENQAIFSVELDRDSTEIIEATMTQSDLMPVGVVYSLDFLALRPAFTVKVTADWNRVQNHFQESFGFDILFASVQIDKVVDKLIEDQVIVIEVDSFLPEGEDAGSWVGRRDQAINDFKDMVLESFFEPSLEPVREEEDGWDKFVHTTDRLALLAATGGWAGAAKFSYTKRDITRIDQKRLNLTMKERVTVSRSIYPQAHLQGLGQQLRDLIDSGQVPLSRFIQDVTLGSDWFKRRKVTAHSLVDYEHDNVESVNATLIYGGQPQTLRLTKDAKSGERQWNSILAGNAMQREVEYEYRVNFTGVDTAERPGVLTAPKVVTIGDEFELSPRGEGLYFVDDIQFGADLLPWDRFPNVSVEVRYDDPDNGIRLAEMFILKQNESQVTWKRFRLNPELEDYQVRVTYLASDHRDIETGWVTTNEERYTIRDPRPAIRSVQVVPAVAWPLVSMVLVELEYIDQANGVRENQMLSFYNTDQDRLPKQFSVNLADPERRIIRYSAQILLTDNRLITIPPSATNASTIIIRTDTMGHRMVEVRTADADFAARGIVRVEADLSFSDPEAGLSFSDQYTFRSPQDVQFFEFDYASTDKDSYSCTVRIVFANGLVQARDLGVLNGDRLILPAA